MKEYQPSESYLRVATGCPEVAVADVAANIRNLQTVYQDAVSQDVSLLTFPELSLTGYTLGDLVNQNQLLERARKGLTDLAETTSDQPTAMVVGVPLQVGNSLYNCAAVLADGQVKGLVPKQNLPTYNEFYEDRWFQAWDKETITIDVNGQPVPFGNNLLFDIAGVPTGVEICEDLWVAAPPSTGLAEYGALLIANPSASPEQVGRDNYRRQLVSNQSGRLIAGYVYAGCHPTESTMDIVMGGHQIIAENGKVVAEREPFGDKTLTVTDIDVEHLLHDRRKQGFVHKLGALAIQTGLVREQRDLKITIDKHPFLPDESLEARAKRLDRVLQVQAQGLAMRMKNTRRERVVIGLSGGLDSTLALFVACEAARILGAAPADMIRTITMPGPASSSNTQSNAALLAAALNAPNETMPIKPLVDAELKIIGHDGTVQDITYENVQARARTSILFNYGNKEHCIVLGTGDLSEIALGWCTFNADHMSHYNVNASIPKTMIRLLVAHAAQRYPDAVPVTEDIIGTPISPELTREDDQLSQLTEDIIGPYELHDFFMTHVIRWGDKPAKIAYLAKQAFQDSYSQDEIDKWLGLHLDRFAKNQFKRSVMPDGPKVGSIALSPRGDWRMPSDMPSGAVWE